MKTETKTWKHITYTRCEILNMKILMWAKFGKNFNFGKIS